MATFTVPAIRAHMGSIDYYQSVMRADELSAVVGAAADFAEFSDFLESERMQRTMSEERVEREIVPYLTKAADRFFGAIIVLVYRPKVFKFELLSDIARTPPEGPYADVWARSGALSISGGTLFALDGQHRLYALKNVIEDSHTKRLRLPIDGPFARAVRNDQLSVIFLPYVSSEQARRIFTKVNRYAKPTTKATNILMSEDDGHAIISRCIASLDDPFKFDSTLPPALPRLMRNGERCVQSEKNLLAASDPHFTTLEVVYKSVGAICKALIKEPLDEKSTVVRPADELLQRGYEECVKWWRYLVTHFKPFEMAINSAAFSRHWRNHDEQFSLALRPVGQEAIIGGLMLANKLVKESPETLIARLNQLRWSLTDRVWSGIFLGGGEIRARVITGQVKLGAELIAYRLTGPDAFGAARTNDLLRAYREAKQEYGMDPRELPKPLV